MDLALKALSDPTRRAILRLVGGNEMTAGEIASQFSTSRPAISQHLTVLPDADLVAVRHEGTRRWYRAQPESLAEARAYLDEMWAVHLAALKTAAEQHEWRRQPRSKAGPSGRPRKKAGTDRPGRSATNGKRQDR